MDVPVIYLRADAPPYRVATELVRRLGFRLNRTLDRQLVLHRAMVTAPSFGIDARVDPMTKVGTEEHASDGYDIRLGLVPRGPDVDVDDTEVWWLFDELCRELGYPALLEDGERLKAGWAPGPGKRVFAPDTFGWFEDRDQWGPYALPAVRTHAAPDPDDVLGHLYARIVADPDDDTLRLAYADAVATDQPDYAELIRLQVEDTARRLAGTAPDPVRRRRANELERALGRDIVPGGVSAWAHENVQIRRGFAETVAVPAGLFLRAASDLVAATPLRMVFLTGGAQERMAELAALPELGRLRGLSFWGNPIGDAGLRVLLSSPYLTSLRWLSVVNAGVTAAGIEALAASEALPRLRYVRAEDALGLYPRLLFDYDGTPVHGVDATLGAELAKRYDRPWLRWRTRSRDERESDPEYDAV